VLHPLEQETRVNRFYFFSLEQEKEKPSKALLPARAPECKDLEKQALEIELQRQENQEQQNESKMTWKQWFKNPDFYKVTTVLIISLPPPRPLSPSQIKRVQRRFSQPLLCLVTTMVVPLSEAVVRLLQVPYVVFMRGQSLRVPLWEVPSH